MRRPLMPQVGSRRYWRISNRKLWKERIDATWLRFYPNPRFEKQCRKRQ